MTEFNFDMNFNSLLILGNSGQGKTQLAKNIAIKLKEQNFKIITVDPNHEWMDVSDQDVSASELPRLIYRVCKNLLFERKEGLLVIDDFALVINELETTLVLTRPKALSIIKLILENTRKYRLKIIVCAHEIDALQINTKLFQKFDKIVCFNFPITGYCERLLRERGIEWTRIPHLKPLEYLNNNEVHKVPIVESHIKIENAQDFTVRQILSQCDTNIKKVFILKAVLGYSHSKIAEVLGLTTDQVKSYICKARKRVGEEILPKENTLTKQELLKLIT